MAIRIVVVSGPVAVGKSILVKGLSDSCGAHRVSTRALIQRRVGPNAPADRAGLQRAGDRLDSDTDGSWVAQEVGKVSAELPADAVIVVDSCRIESQVEGLRHAFGSRVIHVHLTAPIDVLRARYLSRGSGVVAEFPSYEEVRRNRTEKRIDRLADIADLVIDTQTSSPGDVVARALGALRLLKPNSGASVDILVGGQYGSEGKGNVVAHLGPDYDLVIRVGGPNAGHKVKFGADGTFVHHHLPSATHTSSAQLAIAPGAVINVDLLMEEINDCGVDSGRLSIDPQAMVISPADIEAEDSLQKHISSTKQGVGAATARKIMRRDEYLEKPFLAGDVPTLRPFIRPLREVLRSAYSTGAHILVEGVQGTMLSVHHGLYPYVTSRDTTVSGAMAEAGIPPSFVRKTIVVFRTYPIRVQNAELGSSGLMANEISLEDIAIRSKIPLSELQETERTSTTNRSRRIAEFDWDILAQSVQLNGPTDIALTFVDYFDIKNRQARRYEQLTPETIRFISDVERVARCPVSLISTRFHARSIIDRRSW
jgi:adenylosuccinate synthase